MGMAESGKRFEGYFESLQERLNGFPTTVLVLAAENLSFGEVLMPQKDMIGEKRPTVSFALWFI